MALSVVYSLLVPLSSALGVTGTFPETFFLLIQSAPPGAVPS